MNGQPNRDSNPVPPSQETNHATTSEQSLIQQLQAKQNTMNSWYLHATMTLTLLLRIAPWELEAMHWYSPAFVRLMFMIL